MDGCRFSLVCLILAFCVIKVQSGTTEKNPCVEKIPCDDSKCIDRDSWCDEFTDCLDESDEKYCRKKGWLTYPDNNCSKQLHFTCNNRMCIPIALRCDGHNDCKDDSDEKKCGDGSSETGKGYVTFGRDSLESSEWAQSSTTEAFPYSSTTDSFRNFRTVEPTIHYYYSRYAEGGSTPRYNSPTATASVHPPVHSPIYSPGHSPTSYPPVYPPVHSPIYSPGHSPTSNPPVYPPVHSPASYPPVHSPNSYPPVHSPNSYPPVYPPDPVTSTPGPWSRGQRSFKRNPFEVTPLPPSQEPCDTTTSDPVPPYRAPWPPFNFLSSQGGWIRYQYSNNARRARQWLLAHRDTRGIWGEDTPRALVALALSSDDNSNLAANDILQRRLRIALGAKLIKLRKDRRTFRTSVLALYINAFVATCQDPGNVFEMTDLVEMLYRKVQRERSLDASPFPYLTLCLVGRQLTKDDRHFLLDIARRDVTDETSKDKFILATSALACLKKSGQRDLELDRSVEDAFHKLQQLQLKDGSFGSVYSTALAAQAMIAVDSESWDPTSTYSYLSSQQRPDGSFGDFLATYYALPALNGKSLLHLRNIQCQTGPDDPPKTPEPSTTTTTTEITTTPQPIKTVRYRLATEKPYETLAHLDLVVPRGDNFFDIMKKAAAEDKRFRFLHVEHDGKIDVYQISDIPNDPEFGLFWILYEVKKDHDRKLQRYTQDIRNLIPKHSDELIFRYEQFKPGNQ